MAETLYDGPAHGATFYLRADGLVRFRFGNFRASGYVRSPAVPWHVLKPGPDWPFRAVGTHSISTTQRRR